MEVSLEATRKPTTNAVTEHPSWVKRKAEGPLDKQQHKRLIECLEKADETLSFLKGVPERYYVHEWVLVHQFIVNEGRQRGYVSRASPTSTGGDIQESTTPVLHENSSGGSGRGQKPLIPNNKPPLLLEEIFLVETKLAELLKGALVATSSGHYVKLTSTRRRVTLQRLNSNLYIKFAALWDATQSSHHHKLIRDDEGSGLWFTAFKGVSLLPFPASPSSSFFSLFWLTWPNH